MNKGYIHIYGSNNQQSLQTQQPINHVLNAQINITNVFKVAGKFLSLFLYIVMHSLDVFFFILVFLFQRIFTYF